MRMMSEAIEGARDFQGFMDKITKHDEKVDRQRADAHGKDPLARAPGENRAQHRARLKRERKGVRP